MAPDRSDAFVRFAEDTPVLSGVPRHADPDDGGRGVAAIVALGALLALTAVIDLAVAPHRGLIGLDGAYIVRLVLGIGLAMRKQLARILYIGVTILGLLVTVATGAGDYVAVKGSGGIALVGLLVSVGIDIAVLVILLRPSVARHFD